MEPGSRAIAILLLLLLLLSGRNAPASARAPSPSTSPSPSPSPHTTPPKQLDSASTNIQLNLPPPPPPPPIWNHRTHHDHRDHPPAGAALLGPGSPRRLNVGEKVGLAFLLVALALQVSLGGFLVFKRLQLRKVARTGQRMAAPSPS